MSLIMKGDDVHVADDFVAVFIIRDGCIKDGFLFLLLADMSKVISKSNHKRHDGKQACKSNDCN